MSGNLQKAVEAHQAGNLAEAMRLYREVAAQEPNNADALALLGSVCAETGDSAQAVGLISKAIRLDPKAALFRFYLGNALMTVSRFKEAAEAFSEAAKLEPGMAQAHYNLGNALRKAQDWPGAVKAYREAIARNPAYAEAHNNLALALAHEEQFDESMQAARRAVEIAPDYAESWLALCNVAERAGDYDLALQAGRRVTQLKPEDHKSWFGLGVALNRLNRHEEAIEPYKKALALKPYRADIWDNLGQTYQSLNRLEEAEEAYRRTIDVAGQLISDEDKREVAEEEYGNRHWHLALMELLRGKYKEGFARYRSRFQEIGALKRPHFSRPLWRGENLSGKTILVCDEQGYGDTLMLCRYLPMLKKAGARIIFSVHPVLKPLFEGWPSADALIVHNQPIPEYDFYTTTFDLPHRFGTMLETVPAEVPYLPLLAPDADTRLEDKGKKKIGVVWGGSPLHKNDANRSIPLKIFSQLFEFKGAQFYSINRDLKPGDAELLKTLPVIDLAPRLKSFADGARFMRQFDLVITCDTATAHLAGGLARPCWTLITFAPDWRWMLEREDTPWYPTMRLFRQPRIGDWQAVIDRVKSELAR